MDPDVAKRMRVEVGVGGDQHILGRGGGGGDDDVGISSGAGSSGGDDGDGDGSGGDGSGGDSAGFRGSSLFAKHLAAGMARHKSLIADFLLDHELATALMCVNRQAWSVWRADPLVWWTRYRRQYDASAAYRAAKGATQHQEAVLSAAATATFADGKWNPERTEAAKRAIPEMRRDAWQYVCRYWQSLGAGLVGHRIDHASWYEQYRALVTTTAGVSTLVAVVDCDTHAFHCWLPFDTYDRPEPATPVVSDRRIKSRERCGARWVARHALDRYVGDDDGLVEARAALVVAAVAECRERETLAAAVGEPLTNLTVAPAETHALYLTTRARSLLPHSPYVYAPQRIHRDNAIARRYRNAVEYVGVQQKLAEMRALANSGTAFCVHAVHMHGVNYQTAQNDVERAHRNSIADAHCRHPTPCAGSSSSSSPSSSLSSLPLPPSFSPSPPSPIDPDSATVHLLGLRRAVDEWSTGVGKTFGIRRLARRDCPRQCDMTEHWGAGAADWPLGRNLCGRRISAVYARELYLKSRMVSDDSEYVVDNVVAIEYRALPSEESDHKTLALSHHTNRLVMSRRDAIEQLVFGEWPETQPGLIRACYQEVAKAVTHALRGGLFGYIRDAPRTWSPTLDSSMLPVAYVARVFVAAPGNNTAAVVSGSLAAGPESRRGAPTPEPNDENAIATDATGGDAKIGGGADGSDANGGGGGGGDNAGLPLRVWMPFDSVEFSVTCRLCRRLDVYRESGIRRLRDLRTDYCRDCLHRYDKSCRLPWGAETEPSCGTNEESGDNDFGGGGGGGGGDDRGGNEKAREPGSAAIVNVAAIRERERQVAPYRNWCAPTLPYETTFSQINAVGLWPRPVTNAPYAGLVAFPTCP